MVNLGATSTLAKENSRSPWQNVRSKAHSSHRAGAIEVDFPLKPFPFLFMSSDMAAELLLGATEADRDVAS